MSYAKMTELLLLDVMSKAQIPGVSIAFLSSDGTLSTQERGLTEGCGLLAMPVDPLKCPFNKLGLGSKNAVVLFDSTLYYVNQTTQSVQKIQLDESNQSSYQTLRERCTDTYKLADPKEYELITTLTGLPPPREVKPETVFGAASLSKPIFAYLVQKLIQANATKQAEPGTGKFNLDKFNLKQFDLDTPLFHILPLEEFEIDGMQFDMSDKSAVSSAKALTARMVLSHTTGLAHGGMNFQFIPNPEEKNPKEKMHGYSNVGIIYLQQVIEKLTAANLETLAKSHVFHADVCNMTHSTYEPSKVYHSVLPTEKEPLFDEIKPGQIVVRQKDEHLTAYWLENGKMVHRSFPEKEVSAIVELLPPVGKSSNNLDLIKAITFQYKCKEPKPCAANTLRTTAEDYAKFVKHLINDNSIENPFAPHAFMTRDRGLAGAIGIARDKIPEPILNHVAWGLGWGLQTNEKGEVITAYHSGDMNDCRAWVAINLKDKSAVVFFANSHNGHILAEQIVSSKIQIDLASNYFFSKWGFARNLDELCGKTNNWGINSCPKPKPVASQSSMSSLEELQKRNNIPSIATATISDKGVITPQSVGVTNVDKPEKKVTSETVFEAASLSKPVFAYLILKLAQKGVIDLDKPLHKYGDFGPPEMRTDENYKKLTARMILSHQAGLPNEFPSPESEKYISEAGKTFDYSGVAYEFLGKVAENITSKSLETLAQEEFAKLGMTNSSFMPPTGCSLIRLSNEEQEPTSQSIKKLLIDTLDKQGQLSIILHKEKLFVAERAADGSVEITEKNSSQIEENSLKEIKARFAQIPPFFWSKPIPVEARELPLVATVAGHPPEHAATIAIGHDQAGSVNLKQKFYKAHPAGSLYTTASDYAKFLKACVNDPYIRWEMFKPVVSSLNDKKDTKAIRQGVPTEVLEKISWGLGIGLQKNTDGTRIAFHWGDHGTQRHLAAINLTTDEAVVCLTNSENGPAVFRAIAEPIVGDLSAMGQWLSLREKLPMDKTVKERQRLKEQREINRTDDTAPVGQQEGEQKPSGLGLT